MVENIRYIPQGYELEVALVCYELQLPLMLRGPTGVGKNTLVRSLSDILGIPLIKQVGNEFLLPADLAGRILPEIGWIDGSVSRSLRYEKGSIFYFDEIAEVRENALVTIHPLADDEREIELTGNKNTPVLKAPEKWMFVAAYNPHYQQKALKPSTAQRFITIDIPYPAPEIEDKIIEQYIKRELTSGTTSSYQRKIWKKQINIPIKEIRALANDYRKMAESGESGLREGPGPRLSERTALLFSYGLPIKVCLESGMINPLVFEPEQKNALFAVAKKLFKLD